MVTIKNSLATFCKRLASGKATGGFSPYNLKLIIIVMTTVMAENDG